MIAPAPGLTVDQQPENVVLRMLCYGEARGEGARGMNAVLHVVQNRALKSDTTFKKEALRRQQFSCFNESDPNRAKLIDAWVRDTQSWAVCDAVCALFELGITKDETLGATHYYVKDMPNPPAWGYGHPAWEDTAMIGRHRFGRAA